MKKPISILTLAAALGSSAFVAIEPPAAGAATVREAAAATSATSAVRSAPSSTLSKRVDAFVKKYNGRYVDFDGHYGAQCVDLYNFYNRDVVKARRYPVRYASQLYDNYDKSKYTRLSASATPRKGDVAIWSGRLPYSGGAGHVAVVLRNVDRSTIRVFTQNPGPAKVANLKKAHLRGYLRPKV